jgi:Flp pilus assembly pilin Flp
MEFVERAQVSLVMVRTRVDMCLSRLNRMAVRSRGQSTVEYALVGALVVIAAAGAMTLLGDQVSSVFGHITTTLSGAPTGH